MSCSREIHSDTKVSVLLAPLVLNADNDSASVDTVGFNSLLLVAHVGAEGDTLDGSNFIEFQVEESDDDTNFTDVANADLTNYVTGSVVGTFGKLDAIAEAPAVVGVGYKGGKRYVRVRTEFTGTHTTGTPIGIIAIQQHASTSPVNATGDLT